MAKATKAKATEQNTEGAQPGTQAPAAPISAPEGTSASAPAGEVETGLSGSDQDAGDVAIGETGDTLTFDGVAVGPIGSIIASGADVEIIGIDPGIAQADEVTVICHAPDGRRRLGRRWPAGKTPVPLADLSDTDIELLRADPGFSVIMPA